MQRVVRVDSVELGGWDDFNHVFQPGMTPFTAVRIVVSQRPSGLLVSHFGVTAPRYAVRFQGGAEDYEDYRSGDLDVEDTRPLFASGQLRQLDSVADANLGITFRSFPDPFNAPFVRSDREVRNSQARGNVANLSALVKLADRQTLRVDSAYNYVGDITHTLKIGEKTSERTFKSKDQFAPELIELARCIREDREPEPNGVEGLADVRIIEALYTSAIERRPVPIPPLEKLDRPDISQEMKRPAVKKPKLVDVQSASGKE